MRRFPLMAGLLVVVVTACQDQPAAPPGTALTPQAVAAGTGEFELSRGEVRPPAGVIMTDQSLAEWAYRAINPADYVCPPSTPIVDYYLNAAFDIINNEPAIFDLLYNQLLADLIPTYEALFFLTTATPQYFGYHGEYTRIVGKTERQVKAFWDIPSSGIQVVGLHGSMLLDEERVAATYVRAFGVPPALAAFFASLVADAVRESQTINGGNHPLFSFNAFASSAFEDVPPKIIVGDGVLAGYQELGFSDVAPQAMLAHEFAHHIQIVNDYFSDPLATTGTGAERTRYTELMADAMAAYFMTHKRGLTMNQKRVEQFLEVFYQIGDCGFSSGGHHGTPNQRMAAAEFGFELARQALKQGSILSSDQFHDAFVAAYGGIVAPDAP